MYMVFERVYVLMDVIASFGYLKSFIMASRRAWSMEPNVFLKSIYDR